MEFTTCYCPHPQCTHYGHEALALIWSVVEPIAAFLACCAPCVRARFRRARARRTSGCARRNRIHIAMRALAEGNSLRGTGRIVGVDQDTSVTGWIEPDGIVGP